MHQQFFFAKFIQNYEAKKNKEVQMSTVFKLFRKYKRDGFNTFSFFLTHSTK